MIDIIFKYMEYSILVGGLEHEFYDFPSIGNVIVPTDELIFFRGVETTNQKSIVTELETNVDTVDGCEILHQLVTIGNYKTL